jgi:hypothetical protein
MVTEGNPWLSNVISWIEARQTVGMWRYRDTCVEGIFRAIEEYLACAHLFA